MKGHKKLSLVEILTNSAHFSEIVNKVEQLAKLNCIVLQKLDPELARACRVANLREGILILTTTSPALGHQLRFSEMELLSALRALPEWCHLKSIKIQVRPVHAAPNEPSLSTKPNPKFISTDNSKSIKETALNISSDPLQKALLKLSKRVRNQI